MTGKLPIDLGVGFANGALSVVILCVLTRWLLSRIFGVADPRLAAFLFALGLTSGRLEQASAMGGHPAGRFLGDLLAFTLIWYLWWRRERAQIDAMDRP